MSQKLRVLLVEDEDHLLDAIKLNLELEGYKVHAVKDGKTALKIFKEERFNLVILDVMLPEMDGFQVCETIRLENTEVPILFLTAKNTSEDRVMGLKKGADDYLVKPFNLEELILRVGILVKRSLKADDLKELNSYKIGDKTIYFLALIPIFADEMDYKQGKGTAKLFAKFAQQNITEKLDDFRSTVLKTRWNFFAK